MDGDWLFLPDYEFSRTEAPEAPGASEGEVVVCGDHVATPSIQGALESGRRAAVTVAGREMARVQTRRGLDPVLESGSPLPQPREKP